MAQSLSNRQPIVTGYTTSIQQLKDLRPTLSGSALETHNLNPYKYDKLPTDRHFRVAEILPGPPSEPIACHLHSQSLDRGMPYEALSYTWGDVSCKVSLVCHNQTLQVTRSLYEMLERLRPLPGSASRNFWVDALCINQEDLGERGKQVRIMKQIYTNSCRVIIWLGPDLDGSAKAAFMLAQQIAEACCQILQVEINVTKQVNIRNRLDQAGYKVEPLISSDAESWKALQKLYARVWFQRIWVIQEAHAAGAGEARAIVGDLEIDFDVIAVAACWIDWLDVNRGQITPMHAIVPKGIINTLQGVNNAVIMRGSYIDTVPFQTLIHQARVFDATDRRDKVYALLGFSGLQGVASTIFPSYEKSVVEVYTDVAKAILQSHGGVNLLSFVGHGSLLPTDRPSWVPLSVAPFVLYPNLAH